jgi:hypothetical protein
MQNVLKQICSRRVFDPLAGEAGAGTNLCKLTVGCQSIHWPPYNSGFSGVTKHNAINARDAKSSPRNMRQNIPPRFSVPDF